MASILDESRNRVRLLKAGYTGKEIEMLHILIFDNNIEVLSVNWLPEYV